MQSMSVPPKAGKIAFQYGLIFGVIQAVVASGVLFINDFVNTTPDKLGISLLLGVISFLLGLAAYFVSGIFAAKQTGKVSTGTFSGMWTGAIYGIIGFVVSMVLFFQVALPRLLDAMNSSSTAMNADTFRTGAIAGGVGFAIFGILFAVGLGAGLGALGGLIGKNMSKVQPAPVVIAQPYYPAQPAAGPYIEQSGANPYSDKPYPHIEQ